MIKSEKKEKLVETASPREKRFTFENYVMNTLNQIQTDIRELRSEIKSNLKWTISIMLTVFAILNLWITYLHNDNKQAIRENRKAIHTIDKKVDKLEIKIDRIETDTKEILKRLPEK